MLGRSSGVSHGEHPVIPFLRVMETWWSVLIAPPVVLWASTIGKIVGRLGIAWDEIGEWAATA